MCERCGAESLEMSSVCYSEENQIGIIKINRPEALNALNSQLLGELDSLLDSIDTESVGCLLITGAGNRAFAAGADIQEMKDFTGEEAIEFSMLGNQVFQKVEQFPVPVIAVVNGYALGGGCELAMSCDFIMCSENAVFAQPETGLGIIPGFGGTQRLSRKVGMAKAKELIYTGRKMNAAEAYRTGLVCEIYSCEELMKQAVLTAERICANGRKAVRRSKEAIQAEAKRQMYEGIRHEVFLFGECFGDEEQQRRMADFLNKKR